MGTGCTVGEFACGFGGVGFARRDVVSIIRLEDVVKRYQHGDRTLTVLDGVDFSVDSGELVALMGPSGSGKSTLLNILGLLDEPTGGDVYLAGEDVTELDDDERTYIRKETMGFVFQDFHLLSTLTARENVELPLLLSDEFEGNGKSERTLERVGLGHRQGHYPSQLSGGQQQRVAIARALVTDPDLILADEPTGNLDRETGTRILEEIESATSMGVAVVIATHDPKVSDYATRTVDVSEGRLEG